MENKIKILDCTLRDGGYVNNWEFSTDSTKETIKSLIDSKVEIIECGFVNQKIGTGINSTLFKDIYQVNDLLKSIETSLGNSSFCIMINKGDYDLNTLPCYNQKSDMVSGIRYAFHKKDWKEALSDVEIIINKGYQVYVQAMVTLSYSDSEILEIIAEVNNYDVYAMYIVDSFGAMFGDDFKRLHYLFENNLRPEICLGYHSHNNLQLAYSNTIDFIQIKELNREIIIDSSIYGMGRGAGNLTTELVADYLNKKKHTDYNIIPLLETIDKYLEAIYRENYWGYSIAHFLSASFGCHPNYSTFLVNTKTLSIVDMQKILSLLDNGEKEGFDKKRIDELYIDYKSNEGLSINFKHGLFNEQNLLILASGSNAITQKAKIEDKIKTMNPTIIAVNHIPIDYSVDYYFFSNQKRYNKFIDVLDPDNIIITTNIHVKSDSSKYKVVDYNELVIMTSNRNDNAAILLLNLLINEKIKEVYIAGFDGYNFDKDNYSYTEYDRNTEKKELIRQNESILISLSEVKKYLSVNFITDSIFK